MTDLSKLENRQSLLVELNNENTKARKQWSQRSSEVQGGRIQQYVKENLEGQLNVDSVKEMPIVSTINIQKSIVSKNATIYKKAPKRTFSDVSETQQGVLDKIYKDMKLDTRLNKSNKNFIYQDQSIGMIVPKDGKLICRILKMHQIDAISDLEDPESSNGYIISAFDRTHYIQLSQDKAEKDTATGNEGRSVRSSASELTNEKTSDEYQFKKYTEKYIVWTKQYNFMMNGIGELIDPDTGLADSSIDIVSPLASEGIMPFFEVARDKDFEYFVRPSNTLTDFTIQFNSQLSDLANNIKMNGYAVAVLTSQSDQMPTSVTIGATMLLKLKYDNPDLKPDFKFASPDSKIAEISEAIDTFLNYFTTTEGGGSDIANSQGETQKFNSGLDRFIAMVSRIEAHQDDYESYRDAESDIYKLILAWNRVLKNSNQLKSKYQLGLVSEDSEVSVVYNKPEMIQTETEKIDTMDKKINVLGTRSKVDAIMEEYEITDRGVAKKKLEELDEENKITVVVTGDLGDDFPKTESGDDNNTGHEDDENTGHKDNKK